MIEYLHSERPLGSLSAVILHCSKCLPVAIHTLDTLGTLPLGPCQ